ncbi:MAG: glycosyltransferase family 2 protein [Actinomycetota bacterium]|nr:glycosyltransferase family 2 protein [Actinomycetota bacterium]
MSSAEPLVTVLVPTHDHASTLDLAVGSVLTQTVEALDVVIVGDGVGDDTRDVVAGLVRDRRVRFLDAPKSTSRSELLRHRVLNEARSPYVCYLGDDDVMLTNHVEATVARLRATDFTHPLPLYIERDGLLCAHPTDLADAACVAWHLGHERNAISLTGVGHRLDAYRLLPHGWREPPAGSWSDHYMWQQWFAVPHLRFSTGDRLTVLKFAANVRSGLTPAQRRGELQDWIDRSTEPDFERWLAAQAGDAFRRHAIQTRLELDAITDQSTEERQVWEQQRLNFEVLLQTKVVDLEVAEASIRQAHDELRALRSTRTWRLHDRLVGHAPLRWLARR